MDAPRQPFALALLVFTLAVAGLLLPRWFISDGIDQYRGDPASYAVAVDAYYGALNLNDNPIGRAFMPAAQVVSVGRQPGHCVSGPGSDQPHADYVARVRFYTFFGIPAGTVHVSCGGWLWSWFPPEAIG